MTTTVTTLPGGLRVVTDRMETVETATLGAWIEVGTRHERPEINGISHLLEHMAFKGTRRRSARAIAEEIEAVGGHLNAYTARENTAYYAKVLKEDVALAVDLIADILQHSVMDPAELDRERAVILQEISQANDTPDDIIFDHFQATAYPDQALGWPVLGTADKVEAMGRDTVLDYLRATYSASHLVFSAAGRVDHQQVVELVGQAFDSLPAQAPLSSAPARFVGGEYRELRDLEQVQLVLGFDGVGYGDPDYYAALVFSGLFGGGMSSRLFQEIRETRGLAYSVYSYGSSYLDGGHFAIHAGTGEQEAAELVPVLCEEIQKARRSIGEEEVARSRAQIKAGILMGLESTSARCEQRARQLQVFGRPLSVAEVVAKVEAVDVAMVLNAARRITAGAPVLATLGPIAMVESYEKIVERLR